MFPRTQDLPDVTNAETVMSGKSFLFDFTAGDFIIRDGKLVECTGTGGQVPCPCYPVNYI